LFALLSLSFFFVLICICICICTRDGHGRVTRDILSDMIGCFLRLLSLAALSLSSSWVSVRLVLMCFPVVHSVSRDVTLTVTVTRDKTVTLQNAEPLRCGFFRQSQRPS